MNNPKTTIWGTIAAVGQMASTQLTGVPQLAAQLVTLISGFLFAKHAQDASK